MADIQKLFLPFVLMVLLIVLANVFVLYPFQPFGLTQLAKWATWGTIIYPATFLVNDITNRLYGTQLTTKLILASFPVGLFIAGFAAEWRIAIASGVAFAISQQMDNKIFDRLRHLAWWQAPLISSTAATFFDTWIFYIGAFAGATASANYFGMSAPLWVGWSLGDLAFKLMVALLLLLPYRIFLQLILSRQSGGAP